MAPRQYEMEFWIDPDGKSPVRDYVRGRPKDVRVKFGRTVVQLEKEGPRLPRPWGAYLRDKMHELRVFEAVRYRFLHFFHQNLAIVTNGFVKKQGSVPAKEIEKARRLRAEWLKWYVT